VKKDPLEGVAKEEERRTCTHPNLQFSMWGYRLTCIDCKRRWIAANDKFEIPDYTYCNPKIEGEFRHSPNEAPRREELKKPAKKT
jgi:hypothetical protein